MCNGGGGEQHHQVSLLQELCALSCHGPWVDPDSPWCGLCVVRVIANDCTGFIMENGQSHRILVDQPAMWTEDEGPTHTLSPYLLSLAMCSHSLDCLCVTAGWFQSWGDHTYPVLDPFGDRSPEDMAYVITRWFAYGGCQRTHTPHTPSRIHLLCSPLTLASLPLFSSSQLLRPPHPYTRSSCCTVSSPCFVTESSLCFLLLRCTTAATTTTARPVVALPTNTPTVSTSTATAFPTNPKNPTSCACTRPSPPSAPTSSPSPLSTALTFPSCGGRARVDRGRSADSRWGGCTAGWFSLSRSPLSTCRRSMKG